MELDQTTFYSILGLSSNATNTEISKSYKNLARRLHPDKSKSTDSEELFKVIVEAHSILTDEQEKLKYDRQLMLKGLYAYDPVNKMNATTDKSFGVPNYHRKSKPYESQPYGFGFETGKSKDKSNPKNNESTKKSSKSTKFKSFNVKSYQRSQRRYPDEPVNNNNNDNTTNDMDFSETSNNYKQGNTKKNDSNVPLDTDMPIEEEISSKESTFSKGKDESVEHIPFIPRDATPNVDEINERKKEHLFSEDDENQEYKEESRSKMHKSDPATEQSAPTWDYIHRQHLRTKQRNKESVRRSNSPIKMSPTTNNIGVDDNWKNNLRDIIDKMNNIDQKNSAFTTTKRSEDIAFDLENINESLDSIPIPSSKRSKTDEDDGFLHKPVNTTLPRVYRKEVLREDESFIIPEILEGQLPNLPTFNVDISNPIELENCKNDLIRFNTECNDLKRQILSTYMNRLMFDMHNSEKLIRMENNNLWLKTRRFDAELTNKIQELEYKQSMVAHTFSNIISGMYPTDNI